MKGIITYENLRSFAYSNDALIKGRARGVILNFMGLNCNNMYSEDPERGVDTAAVFCLEYADGTLATAYASLDSYARGWYCVVGEKGRIEVPCNFNCRNEARFSVKTGGHTDNVEVLDEVVTTYSVMCPQNYMLEIEQFGRVVAGEEAPLVSREETLCNAAVLDMVFADLQ